MKRIVNGHYADAGTTWDVVEMSPEYFDGIKDSVIHIKKKYDFLIGLSDEAWRDMMKKSAPELSQVSLDEFAMSDDTMIESRKVLSRDKDILIALEARILLLALSNKMDEITGLSFDEFRVLIDAIRQYCVDTTHIINSSREELLKAIKDINKNDALIGEEKLNSGLDRVTTEEYQEQAYEKVQILYSILEIINQPYEGAEYVDSNGNKLDTTKQEPKPTSIN